MEVIQLGKSQERLFEALNYGKTEKAKLTTKQYLVYSYLMSVSKWDAQDKEKHYYVYKNSFLIKDVCVLLNISQPTWRSAIKKLKEKLYIQEFDKYYIIDIPNTYAPLNISLIKFLLQFGSVIDNGGNIISVYSLIYRYYKFCCDNNQICEITINQLRKIFNTKSSKEVLTTYRLMIDIFEIYNLMEIDRVGKQFQGNPYLSYVVKNVNLNVSKDLISDNGGPDNIENIIAALAKE